MKPLVTVLVAGLQYLIHPTKLGSIEETINPDAILPVTLLTTEEIFGDIDGLLQFLDEYDDVFSPAFGGVLVEKPGSDSASKPASLKEGLDRQVYHLGNITSLDNNWSELPSGPYILHGPNLHQAWRLYDDDFGAFAFGVIPEDANQPDKFQVLASLSTQGDSKSVAVPSRLYFPQPSNQKPLSGVRIAISDLVSLKGTPSSLSSRAWRSLHTSVSTTTADFAQKLIDLGAIIVGKTKASPLGTGTNWVDEQAPWSARGDGYQALSGVSSGNSASLIGYKWLQQSIGGNDDGFSAQDGVYTLSTSPGSISHDGIINISKNESVGLYSRSLEDLLNIASASLGANPRKANLPSRVLYPVDMHHSSDQQSHSADFISTLEDFLGVSVEKVNLEDIWAKSRPSETHSEVLQEYLKDAPFHAWCYEYYHKFEDFISQYRDTFGTDPYVETVPKSSLNTGATVTDKKYQEYSGRLELFRKWFDQHVMPLAQTTPNAEAIIILPCGTSHVLHRDEPTLPPTTPEGVKPEFLAAVLGAPLLSIPFAQVPYESQVSGNTEYKPVCVSLAGTRGSEVGMIQLVKQAFAKAHWQTRVGTGRFAFPPEQESRAKEKSGGLQVQNLQDEL